MNKPTIAFLFTSLVCGGVAAYFAVQSADKGGEIQDLKNQISEVKKEKTEFEENLKEKFDGQLADIQKNVLETPSILLSNDNSDNDSELSKEQIAAYLRRSEDLAIKAAGYCRKHANTAEVFENQLAESSKKTNGEYGYEDTTRAFNAFLTYRMREGLMSFGELNHMLQVLNENKITLTGKISAGKAQFFDYGDGRKVLMVGGSFFGRDRAVLDLVDRLNKLNFSMPGQTISIHREEIQGHEYVYFSQAEIGKEKATTIFGEAPKIKASINIGPCLY